jgi:hypothetical protein
MILDCGGDAVLNFRFRDAGGRLFIFLLHRLLRFRDPDFQLLCRAPAARLRGRPWLEGDG